MRWRKGAFRLYLLLVWVPWAVVLTYVSARKADFSVLSEDDWRAHYAVAKLYQDRYRCQDSLDFEVEKSSAHTFKRRPDSTRVHWAVFMDSTQLANRAKEEVASGRHELQGLFLEWAGFAVAVPGLLLGGLLWALSGFTSHTKEKV